MTINSDILSTAKQIFISFSLIVYSQLAVSQNQLKGKVISETTQEPIPLVSVYLNNTMELNGFEMRSLHILSHPGNLSGPEKQLISSESIGFAVDSNTAGFYFQDSLEIIYTHKVIPNAYKRISKMHKNETFPVSQLLFINKRPVFIISSGYYYGPEDLKITGFWAWWETMANMLPYDYWPATPH